MKSALPLLLLFFLLTSLDPAYSQLTEAPSDTVTISGVVLDAESISPVSFATVSVKNKPVATVTDNSGFFKLTVIKADTLAFSALGYKEGTFVLPENLPDNQYSLVELLVSDTLLLDEVVVLSYPTVDDFREAFMEMDGEEGVQSVSELQYELDMLLQETYEQDHFYYDQMRYARLYRMTGEHAPNNFINPITWANFVRDWREGEFDTEAPLPERMPRRGVNLIDDDQ